MPPSREFGEGHGTGATPGPLDELLPIGLLDATINEGPTFIYTVVGLRETPAEALNLADQCLHEKRRS